MSLFCWHEVHKVCDMALLTFQYGSVRLWDMTWPENPYHCTWKCFTKCFYVCSSAHVTPPQHVRCDLRQLVYWRRHVLITSMLGGHRSRAMASLLDQSAPFKCAPMSFVMNSVLVHIMELHHVSIKSTCRKFIYIKYSHVYIYMINIPCQWQSGRIDSIWFRHACTCQTHLFPYWNKLGIPASDLLVMVCIMMDGFHQPNMT